MKPSRKLPGGHLRWKPSQVFQLPTKQRQQHFHHPGTEPCFSDLGKAAAMARDIASHAKLLWNPKVVGL